MILAEYLNSATTEQLQLDSWDLAMDLATLNEYVRVAPEIDQYRNRSIEVEQDLWDTVQELKRRGAHL